MSKKIPNASEMGKLGGKKRFEQIGSKGMAELGAKGRETIKKNDPDFYKRLAATGLAARKAKKKKRSSADSLVDIITGKNTP